jgi:hypothetical protein
VIDKESVSHDSTKFESLGSIVFPSSSENEKSLWLKTLVHNQAKVVIQDFLKIAVFPSPSQEL